MGKRAGAAMSGAKDRFLKSNPKTAKHLSNASKRASGLMSAAAKAGKKFAKAGAREARGAHTVLASRLLGVKLKDGPRGPGGKPGRRQLDVRDAKTAAIAKKHQEDYVERYYAEAKGLAHRADILSDEPNVGQLQLKSLLDDMQKKIERGKKVQKFAKGKSLKAVEDVVEELRDLHDQLGGNLKAGLLHGAPVGR